MLAAGAILWLKQSRTSAIAPVAGTAAATQTTADETARLRAFARSVAQRVVLLQPGEELPPHVIQRDYHGGWNDYEPKREIVSPALVFERALWDAAAERKLAIEPARGALRDFAARVGAGAASEFLDSALARFITQDYTGAERLALDAAAEIERASRGNQSGDSGAQWLRVIADSGHALREAGARQREALRLAGDAAMLQSKFWEAETRYLAAAQLVARSDAAALIEAQWRVGLARSQRARSDDSLNVWREILRASTTRYGPEDRLTLTAQSWYASEWRRLAVLHDPVSDKSRQDEWLEIFAIRQKRFGSEDLDVGRGLYQSSAFLAHSRDENALALALESLHIREKRLGLEHPEVLQSLRRVVDLYPRQAHAAILAMNHARRALALSERLFGPVHPEVATDVLALANVLQEAQSGPEIVALHRRALALRTAALGWDHAEVARQRHALDSVLGALEKPLEGEAFLRRRAETLRQQHGPEHVEVAASLAALGRYLDNENRREESSELYRQTLAICDRLLGDAPADVPDLHTRLALLNAQEEALTHLLGVVAFELIAAEHFEYRETQARGRMLKTRLELAESRLGTSHPDVADHLTDYAEFVRDWGKPAEAEPLYRRLLELDLRLFGPNDLSTNSALQQVYHYQTERGAWAEREALARWMLAYREESIIPPALKAELLYEVAVSLRPQDKSRAYEATMWSVFTTMDAIEPARQSEHLHWRLQAVGELARFLRSEHRESESEVLYRSGLALAKAAGHEWKRPLASISTELGGMLAEGGRDAEAEALLRDACQLFSGPQEGFHDEEFNAKGTLGVLCVKLGKPAEAQPLLASALEYFMRKKEDFKRNNGGADALWLAEWMRDETRKRALWEKSLAAAEACLKNNAKSAPLKQ